MTTGESDNPDSDWQAARDEGARRLENGDCESAIEVLAKVVADDPSGESHYLLGTVYYRSEKYQKAATHYDAALERNPVNDDWLLMASVAKSNAVSEVNVPVPEQYYFDRDQLLAPSRIDDATLPPPPPPPRPPRRLARILRFFGRIFGAVVTVLMNSVTYLCGTIFGYRDRVWTNWYRRPSIMAVLTLAYMREKLNKKNLKNTYLPGSLVGFQEKGQTPQTPVSSRWRFTVFRHSLRADCRASNDSN